MSNLKSCPCEAPLVLVVGPSNLVWSGDNTLCREGDPYLVLKLHSEEGYIAVTERDALLGYLGGPRKSVIRRVSVSVS